MRNKETGFDTKVYEGYSQVRPIAKIEEERPWNFLEIVQRYIPEGARFLDAGCGNTFKLEELAGSGTPVARFTGFDINQKLLREAQNKSLTSHLNLDLLRADINSPFPFPDQSFDVVTFMLARHNAAEAYRVLKPGGIVIMERVGEGEKREVKVLFGSDKEGPRGYLSEKEEGSLLAEYLGDFKAAGFSILEALSGKWATWVDKKGLLTLLQNTPFVRKFDPAKDAAAVDEAERLFTTEKGIALTQHRLAIVALK